MATFYARIQGNRGEATRIGSNASGVRAEVSTYRNIIATREYVADTHSGFEAGISVRGGLSTGGETVLHLAFDANSLIQHADDVAVQEALQDVKDAFDTLDLVVSNVAEESQA